MMDGSRLERAVGRVAGTTLAIGAAGAAYEWATAGWRAGLALAVGAVISWLNFRWLRSGVTSFSPVPVAAHESGGGSGETVKPPAFAGIFLKFTGRIVLLLVALYVILSRSLLPSVPLLAGLFASVAAVLAQMIYLLVSGGVAKSG